MLSKKIRENVLGRVIYAWISYKATYRRTKIGIIWPAISSTAFVFCLGVFFSKVMNQEFVPFLLNLAWGFAIWSFISGVIVASTQNYSTGKGSFLSGRQDLLGRVFHICIIQWIEYFFQSIPAVLATLFLSSILDINLINVLILNALLFFHAMWVCIILSIICAYLGDVAQIVNFVMRVGFLVTPIVWIADGERGEALGPLLDLNLFYHVLDPIRSAWIGASINYDSVLLTTALLVVGSVASYFVYRRYAYRALLWD